MNGRVTISDVAREAGVSVATVSKVINGRYGVAARTSAHVKEVVETLGYESSIVARSLRSHRTNVLGVLVAEFEPFSAEILKGVAAGVGDSGYEMLAYSGGGNAGSDVGWERRSLSRLSGTLIDGAVIVTPTVVDVRDGVPVVAIDPHSGPAQIPSVDSDSFAGAVQATEHLIGLGHRRIAFLGGRTDLESSRQREDGFRAAMTAAGLPVDPGLVRVGGYRRESADRPSHELLELPDRPTAVFAANDLMAIATIDAARDLGLDVPGDLSVVGFDDVPEASRTSPPLTTVAQPLQEMGARAAGMLIARLRGEHGGQDDGGADPHPHHVRLPTRLVERASTAGPR